MENKRRIYFIEKGFQARFIIKFCLLILAACAFLSALVYALSGQTVTTAFENSRLVIKSTADFMLPTLLLSSALSAILICVATIMVILFISHKIAGPIYRFKKSAEAIAAGNLKFSVHIREKDQLQPLAKAFDEMVSSLKNNIKDIKNTYDDIEKNKNNPLLLAEKMALLKEKLDFFKTKDA